MSAFLPVRRSGNALDAIWLPILVATTLFTALVPLIWNRKHYFVDDSVNGAFGQWFHLGTSLLHGQFPLLEPTVWSSGNLLAEGQWGLFNPIVITISIGAALASDAAVFTTVVKIIAIVIGGLATYFLVRQLGARAPLAFVAGAAAPFAGFTTFFDSPSWVTGLFAWSLMPLYWGLLLRVGRGAYVLLPFVVGYFIISIGYVHGTIALAVISAVTLVIRLLRREKGAVIRTLLLGLALGAVALGIHLTSVLTASVTNRGGSAIFMDQNMTLDLSGLAMSPISTALPQVVSWWWQGYTSPVPFAYITCLLPLAAFVRWRRLWRVTPQLIYVAAAGGCFLVFIMLPTVIGPLRYPTRLLPYLALCVIAVIAVGLDRAREVGRSRLLVAISLILVPLFLAWAQTPQYWKRYAIAAVFCGAALAVVALLGRGVRARRRMAAAAGVLAFLGVGAFTVQQAIYPRSVWAEQNIPTQVAKLQTQLREAKGDTIVIGNPLTAGATPDLWAETLFANSWYVNPHHVLNRYQLLGFNGFNGTLCLGYLGDTCPELAERLFTTNSSTQLTLADELSLSSVQIIKSADTKKYLGRPPAGWHIAADSPVTQLWVRDHPVASAGGIVYSTPGLEYSNVEVTQTSVRFHVDTAASPGSKIVMSRLPWPGYSVDGGRLGDPAEGFLLTVDVPSGYTGDVSVTFTPAGLPLTVALLGGASGAIVVWSVLAAVVRLRDRRARRES